jgi:hypothetical protein
MFSDEPMSHDIEDLLRRYQPAGPPPSLRARILGDAGDRPRTWPWAAAAAALLGATVALHAARPRLSETWADPAPQHREIAIAQLAEMLGGGDIARWRAEQAVARDEAADAMTPVGTSGSDR